MRLPVPLIIIFLFFCQPSFAQQTLALNTFAGPPLSTPEQTGFYDRILIEAFSRIGIAVTIGHLPAERSLVNANSGIDDGDFVRISGLEKIYPNLVRVPEKITDFEFVAFTKHLNLRTDSWMSLNPYYLGIVRGWKILEENLAGAQALLRMKNQRQLFKLLKNGRADAVVYSRLEGYGLMKELKMDDVIVLEPPLARREMFLYLNKKHAGLVPAAAAALQEMKRDGTYDRIKEETLSPYIPLVKHD